MPTKDGKIRVLSINGGGIRGILPAMILNFVEEQTKRPIHESFDIIAGSSTGGILASALTMPMPLSANDCLNLYLRRGKEIFSNSAWQRFKSLGGNVGPKYDGVGLRRVLSETLRGFSLQQALTPTFLTAYAIEKRAPIFFKSWVQADTKIPLIDACLATSAGPTYFPPTCVNGDWYIDGGVINNNPALSAVIEACMLYKVHTRDCIVLSLGTGVNQNAIANRKAQAWGNLQWVQPLINVFTDGVADLTHYQMTDLMPDDQYLHCQIPLLEKNSPMDEVSGANLGDLLIYGHKMLDLNRAKLLPLCERL